MSKKVKITLPLTLLLLFAGIILSRSSITYAATVAKIGSKSYSSLQSAVDAVKANQTIKLQKNITLKDKVYVNNGKKFTIDLKNHVIKMIEYKRTYYSKTLEEKVRRVTIGGVQINKGNVSIKNGNIKGISNDLIYVIGLKKKGEATLSNCKITGNILNSGKLTINSGTYRNDYLDLITNNGYLTIKNGTFISEKDCYDLIRNEYKCTIKGGTFTDKCGSKISSHGNSTRKKASLSINGGTFTFVNGGGIGAGSNGTTKLSKGTIIGSVSVGKGGNFIMSGGSIANKINYPETMLVSGSFTMKGGTITAVKSAQHSSTAISVDRDGKVNLIKGTVTGGDTSTEPDFPGFYIDYPVIFVFGDDISSVRKSGATIINNGQGPDISTDLKFRDMSPTEN